MGACLVFRVKTTQIEGFENWVLWTMFKLV